MVQKNQRVVARLISVLGNCEQLMALLDISQVTQTFVTALQSRLPSFADWPMATPVTVSPAAPDSVGANHAVSFYLYHIKEAAHTKNQDWQASQAQVPQAFKSMGLTLYYIMTPRSNIVALEDRAYADQLTMGLALKTLNETPIIDDTTTVDSNGGPVIVMPLAMRGRDNRLRISLRPTPANEASEYWQAGTLSARLSAYYEVEATLLEPEQLQSRSGRVFAVGVHTFLRKHPQIAGTRNTLDITLPDDIESQTLNFSPAEVTIGDTLEIFGSDLKGDSATTLLFAHRDFVDAVEADAAWSLETNGSTVTVTVQAIAGAQPIFPGIYGAFIRTTDRRRLPDGRYREFDRLSNQVALAITPRILNINLIATDFVIQVLGFEPHLLSSEEILLFVGQFRLQRIIANPPGQGEFVTPAAPPVDTDKVIFRLPAGTVAGSQLMVRLVVKGAESGPQWVEAP